MVVDKGPLVLNKWPFILRRFLLCNMLRRNRVTSVFSWIYLYLYNLYRTDRTYFRISLWLALRPCWKQLLRKSNSTKSSRQYRLFVLKLMPQNIYIYILTKKGWNYNRKTLKLSEALIWLFKVKGLSGLKWVGFC